MLIIQYVSEIICVISRGITDVVNKRCQTAACSSFWTRPFSVSTIIKSYPTTPVNNISYTRLRQLFCVCDYIICTVPYKLI